MRKVKLGKYLHFKGGEYEVLGEARHSETLEEMVVYKHYFDGKWLKGSELKISVFDLSVLRGFGVFDFLRTYKRQPFRLGEHVSRLFNSAQILGLKVPRSSREIAKLVDEGIKKNPHLADLNIRIVVTGGIGPDSTTPGISSLIILFSKAIDYPADYYKKGIKVITFQAKRTLPGAKSLNYLAGILALQEAKKQKATEAIYVDEKGKMSEAVTSNFFAVIGGRLVTPKESILLGITRKVVLDLAQRLKTPVLEKDLSLKEIAKFQEAFITASNKEIMPVVKIDNQTVGDGRPGKLTKALMGEFGKITRFVI